MSKNQFGRGESKADYEFSQAPGVAARGLYRDPLEPKATHNIMYDKRVVRGNTYATPVVPPTLAAEIERKAKEEEDRTRRRMKETRRQTEEAQRRAAGTPEPVPGRFHADMQTETFLEVISDRAPEAEIGVQTDAMLDRPPTPLFVPKPRGHDATTQIEPGELFNFDYEVTPVLEVLVGKTLETSLLEVLQEDELAAIRARQEEYESVRNAELAEVQRLEAEVKRRQAEKARRLDQEKQRALHETEVQRKVASSAFARSFLLSMRGEVFQRLSQVGFFYDPLRREIETLIMPEIFEEVEKRTLARDGVARALADELIVHALSAGKEKMTSYINAQLEAERQAAEAARKLVEEAAAAEAAAKAAAAEAEAAAKAETEGGSGEGEGEAAGEEGEGAAE